MTVKPRLLEPQCGWMAGDVANPDDWTLRLDAADIAEINKALALVRDRAGDLMSVTRDDFPLPTVSQKLKQAEDDIINGRGFVLIRGLPRDDYSNDEMCLIYWGIGLHFGDPWPQNLQGHVLGDVTDQGKVMGAPEARGYQMGGVPLPFHSDGADLVGLLCLNDGASGGESAICNGVALYNDFVKEAPDLVAELYNPQPNDFRGEGPEGGPDWFEIPIFTDHDDRLFMRYIGANIVSSQRHKDAPRLTRTAMSAMSRLNKMIVDPKYHVYMKMQPGDMQFINNYHVLHARKEYTDDKESGKVRHLKRFWLKSHALTDRPAWCARPELSHWREVKSISRLDAANK